MVINMKCLETYFPKSFLMNDQLNHIKDLDAAELLGILFDPFVTTLYHL